MNAERATAPTKRLGELLLEEGSLDEVQLRAALGHQQRFGGPLGRTLVALNLASEPVVVCALGRRLGCDVAPLELLPRGPALEEALRLVPRELAVRHAAVPLAATRTLLTVAMADPADVAAVDALSFHARRRVRALLAGERAIARALHAIYGAGAGIPVPPIELAEEDAPAPLAIVDGRSSLRDAPPAHEAPRLADALQRLAAGRGPLTPGAVTAALARVLLARGLVTEAELVAELAGAVRR
jgi:type IV pilus assembly protein PilB